MSNIVGIEYNRVTNTTSTDFPGFSKDAENEWNVEKFKKDFEVNISSLDAREANFDLINIDTSIANAFRRIMISEVPSVAAEYVYFFNNTSVIQDEVLAHRIGLVPLKVDPDMLTWVDSNLPDDEKFTDENTIVLSLNVKCTRNPDAPKGSTDPKELYNNAHVYARDLKFEPQGRQSTTFADCPVVPADPDILLAKLRPGQEISLKAHCILGIGGDHAKFSPVSTASYRLLPQINILQPIKGESARRFQKCFPPGVIGIDEGSDEAYVKDARKDTVSREVLRYEEFADKVKLGRVRNHFIFNVESSGAMTPEEIFFKSVRILKNKAEYLKNCPITQ
ncbi:ASG_G0056640.mRNA.1.CDS.1 [Saccharomyces cerevisiae]|uniref:DNA-directed RNA polymerases I and III subunit RPAC1 n=3 Tax=Saccharomyces cerevisiae TaxID=4932 RepID=C8ZJD2_YEAS8|nr:Rpc40p [Saccharomyces cerevisiae YJM993]AJV92204.1 Rpc40p [Saccharomyces cerevisiae YJM1477]AJV93341.1 Rpc40p [Saccharomyces cerevisiae YJM1526]AJV93781.1 Rpc40p [Saccharomyces cerevisiae YJM1527]AJV95894.1 Rpc40p [Saccharomyces cerevisiae YJM189]AJV96334.1 Rpc40p [Saccharomyces cerevisiae YJM193]AJV97187.1 Rpc40p [Saccharomyces cerevisiae YJM244]AJV97630.1 Rpc40p [Saccharomyces cerevisiae YJM248]AJV98506.1 Rpc40p [Saccharomyces cerevisiae YJM271]AJW00675.1 Rpc40p [Saccharomyces cerevis